MKYAAILLCSRQWKAANRGYKPWFLLLCWLLLPIYNPAWAQDCLEAQGLRFCRIPGGSYLEGSPLNEAGRYANEDEPHRVTLKPFYLAATLTTNASTPAFSRPPATPPPCTARTGT